MSRKIKNRVIKKQKRKDRRKIKRQLERIKQAAAGANNNVAIMDANDQNQVGVNIRSNQKNSSHTDEPPTTSQFCKRKLSSKKSPAKNCGTKAKIFRKITDDQARRLVRRSVHLKNDNQRSVTVLLPKKVSPQKKSRKQRPVKKRAGKKLNQKSALNVSSSLEEGELRSVISSDDEDDCLVIEPTLEEITIDDNDDEDFPITTDVSTHYQSLVESFKERGSSTPFCKRVSPSSGNHIKKTVGDDILPFFVDVGRGTESINSTDNFTDYAKLTTLRENSSSSVHRSVRLTAESKDLVIELDDISSDNMDVTLKNNSGQMEDDSVIFISETNENDYIPIIDNNLPPHKILKVSEPSTPVRRAPMNSLFTQSETKKLNIYNNNAYVPNSSDVPKPGKRMVIIDGSNVAFKHGLDQEFSVKGIRIVLEYFEKMGHEVKAVIPQFRMNKTKSSNQEELLKLHKAGKIVQTPCKNLPGHTSTSYDDRFILQLAFATDAAIVSNDNYRDLIHENPAFKKIIENRVIGYTWCNDIFILPKDPYGKWGPTLDTILNRS